jgi:hypothetical protein
MPVECLHTMQTHRIQMQFGFIINYVIIVGLIILMLRVIRRTADQIAIHDTREQNSLSKDIHIRGHRCEKNDTFRL